jgi:phage FluMu protein Com
MTQETNYISLEDELANIQTLKLQPLKPEESIDEEKIVFYCTKCEKLIAPNKSGKSLKFKCPDCKTNKVAFGTQKSIVNYFHLQNS